MAVPGGLTRRALSGFPGQSSPWPSWLGGQGGGDAGTLPAGSLGLPPPGQHQHDDHAAGEEEKGGGCQLKVGSRVGEHR